MPADKIQLTEEKETLFLTLYGKALDYRSKNSILNDSYANEIVEKVAIDLSKFENSQHRIVAVRARQFDDWVNDFLSENGNAVILNLGCGLDTRISRIKPPNTVRWFDVDYPEVIELRKQFYTDKENYKMIGSSVTEEGWIREIPNNKKCLIVAEGLFSYLSESEVKTLINRLTNYFSEGEIIFNTISSFTIKKATKKLRKNTGAIQKWAVNDLKVVDQLNNKWSRKASLSLFESKYMKQLSFIFRTLLKMANSSAKYRKMVQLLRYEF